ncbi:hypothetical protein BDQ17DRAFT_1354953 [Cyathus striatus]|nr:hypothetical protein BDQ17DRAFT_1382516 [Cyathus striatus]KAF9004338.1 hypothetical protein BDQ17DRAFT_1354953 [Cyathus striatus]
MHVIQAPNLEELQIVCNRKPVSPAQYLRYLGSSGFFESSGSIKTMYIEGVESYIAIDLLTLNPKVDYLSIVNISFVLQLLYVLGWRGHGHKCIAPNLREFLCAYYAYGEKTLGSSTALHTSSALKRVKKSRKKLDIGCIANSSTCIRNCLQVPLESIRKSLY